MTESSELLAPYHTVWVSHGFSPEHGIVKRYHTEELTEKEIQELGVACTLVEIFRSYSQAKHFCDEMNQREIEEKEEISKLFEKEG